MSNEYMIVAVRNGRAYIARENPGDSSIPFADTPATAADLLLRKDVDRVRMILDADAMREVEMLFKAGGSYFE